MNPYRKRLRLAWLCLVVGALLADCAGTGPVFVQMSHPPNALIVSPLATPDTAIPAAETPEPVGPPAAVYDLGDFTILHHSGSSSLATPGTAFPPTETPEPFGPSAAAYNLGDFTIPKPSGSSPLATRDTAFLPTETPEKGEIRLLS